MRSLLLMMLMAGPALAQDVPIGIMEVMRRALPQSAPDHELRQGLELRSLDVSVELHGDAAETRVEHDFYNDSDERLEGTFRFPVPIGAEITALSMEIDGHMVDGELLERKKAERIYEEIVDEMRDPALLTWEAGSLFKLRVFPIEPNSHKRVVIRYLTTVENARYVFTATPSQPVAHFHFTVDGKTLFDEGPLQPRIIAVEAPHASHRALREVVDGKTYVRLELPVNGAAQPRARAPFRWVIVVDVSRSALEARPLALDAVRAALSALPDSDQFMILACDIECRETAFSPVRESDAALRFLDAIEFDGATDLTAALKLAAMRAGEKGGQVLYIGDGNATWGVTDPAEISTALEPLFAKLPLHAVVVGKFARPTLLTKLANRGGGLVATPARRLDLAAFQKELGGFGRVARVRAITLSANGAVLSPSQPASIDAGGKLKVFLSGEKMPASVHLHAFLNDQEIDRDLPIGDALPTQDVARRFAGARIRELEVEGGHDEEVHALSLKHRVLSSKTAWLVLENDEAYRRHQIERKQQKDQQDRKDQKDKSADPEVSGKDLESNGDTAGDHIGGEGPEPELWLVAGLMLIAFYFRKRVAH